MAGALITALNEVRTLLSKCYWWQNADPSNVRNETEALAAIYVDALPKNPTGEATYSKEELAALRPYAIVERSPGDGFHAIAQSSAGCHNYRGHHVLTLRISTPDDLVDDEHALGLYVEDLIDKIIKTGDSEKPGLLDLGVPPDRLMIRELKADVYFRVAEEDREEHGDFVWIEFDLWWGPR